MLPEIQGVISPAEVVATGRAIASVQLPDGAIPWEAGRHVDPWNHIEAAMALDIAGLTTAADRAYAWLERAQREDGSWAMSYRNGEVEDGGTDANFTAYVAAGVWHHYLATWDEGFLRALVPVVERALECSLSLQAPGGEVWWARDAVGRPWPAALLSSSSCIHLSLRCGIAAEAELGQARPEWEVARQKLAAAIAGRPEAFLPKARYAMDWYYPVLSGAVGGDSARSRLTAGWEKFVEAGLGVRCVSDRPWVTVAESSELVLALDVAGLDSAAAEVLGWIAPRRELGGSYWTGVTYPGLEPWPLEKPTWTAAAVLLAADALGGSGATSGFFRGETFVTADEDLAVAG